MEAQLLNSVPDYLCITQMLKASPSMEQGERFVYLEASNETRDQQGEIVLAKALAESSDYYLRYGNMDLDHLTQLGPKAGIADYALYEIGRPVEVKVSGGRTLVKGQIYSGSGPVAEKANQFWSSLTELTPPQRWYPSVGGAVMEKALDIDPDTGAKRAVIKKVRWTNIGFSKTPVNQAVPTVSTVPFGALAKCWAPSVSTSSRRWKLVTAQILRSSKVAARYASRACMACPSTTSTCATGWRALSARGRPARTLGRVSLLTTSTGRSGCRSMKRLKPWSASCAI